ncbi:MAG: hypothetical protein MJZ84_03735 [Paludibacteraceae bacterium]|nr:hypothetical protein [Paludibacteraceae bacterium]
MNEEKSNSESGLSAQRSNSVAVRQRSGLIVIAVILALALIALGVVYYLQHRTMSEIVEQMEFEKEQLTEEYEDLALQFDGYRNLDIQNDSLQEQLSREQQRVQNLLEELRITKATSARRIAELKKELTTLRAVMVDYVRQIDSLNTTNTRLTEENNRYRQLNNTITRENNEIKSQNTQLQEVVNRASMLELTSCKVTTLNKRDRKTPILSQVVKLQVDYEIAKNVTCDPGLKTIYLRLIDPNGELLQNDTTQVCLFEGSEIGYSSSQTFEYEREAMAGVLYFKLANTPQQGYYNADFIVDGNLIGSYPFEIHK